MTSPTLIHDDLNIGQSYHITGIDLSQFIGKIVKIDAVTMSDSSTEVSYTFAVEGSQSLALAASKIASVKVVENSNVASTLATLTRTLQDQQQQFMKHFVDEQQAVNEQQMTRMSRISEQLQRASQSSNESLSESMLAVVGSQEARAAETASLVHDTWREICNIAPNHPLKFRSLFPRLRFAKTDIGVKDMPSVAEVANALNGVYNKAMLLCREFDKQDTPGWKMMMSDIHRTIDRCSKKPPLHVALQMSDAINVLGDQFAFARSHQMSKVVCNAIWTLAESAIYVLPDAYKLVHRMNIARMVPHIFTASEELSWFKGDTLIPIDPTENMSYARGTYNTIVL